MASTNNTNFDNFLYSVNRYANHTDYSDLAARKLVDPDFCAAFLAKPIDEQQKFFYLNDSGKYTIPEDFKIDKHAANKLKTLSPFENQLQELAGSYGLNTNNADLITPLFIPRNKDTLISTVKHMNDPENNFYNDYFYTDPGKSAELRPVSDSEQYKTFKKALSDLSAYEKITVAAIIDTDNKCKAAGDDTSSRPEKLTTIIVQKHDYLTTIRDSFVTVLPSIEDNTVKEDIGKFLSNIEPTIDVLGQLRNGKNFDILFSDSPNPNVSRIHLPDLATNQKSVNQIQSSAVKYKSAQTSAVTRRSKNHRQPVQPDVKQTGLTLSDLSQGNKIYSSVQPTVSQSPAHVLVTASQAANTVNTVNQSAAVKSSAATVNKPAAVKSSAATVNHSANPVSTSAAKSADGKFMTDIEWQKILLQIDQLEKQVAQDALIQTELRSDNTKLKLKLDQQAKQMQEMQKLKQVNEKLKADADKFNLKDEKYQKDISNLIKEKSDAQQVAAERQQQVTALTSANNQLQESLQQAKNVAKRSQIKADVFAAAQAQAQQATQFQQQAIQFQQQAAQLQQLLQQSEAKNKQLTDKNGAMQTENEKLVNTNKVLVQQAVDTDLLTTKNNQLAEKNKQLAQNNTDKDKQIEMLNKQLTEQRDAFEKQFDQQRKLIDRQKSSLESKLSDSQKLQNQLITALALVDERDKAYFKSVENNKSLQDKLDEATQKIAAVEQENSKLNSDNTKLSSTKALIDAKEQTLRSQNEALEKQVQDLQKQLADAKKGQDRSSSPVSSVSKQIQTADQSTQTQAAQTPAPSKVSKVSKVIAVSSAQTNPEQDADHLNPHPVARSSNIYMPIKNYYISPMVLASKYPIISQYIKEEYLLMKDNGSCINKSVEDKAKSLSKLQEAFISDFKKTSLNAYIDPNDIIHFDKADIPYYPNGRFPLSNTDKISYNVYGDKCLVSDKENGVIGNYSCDGKTGSDLKKYVKENILVLPQEPSGELTYTDNTRDPLYDMYNNLVKDMPHITFVKNRFTDISSQKENSAFVKELSNDPETSAAFKSLTSLLKNYRDTDNQGKVTLDCISENTNKFLQIKDNLNILNNSDKLKNADNSSSLVQFLDTTAKYFNNFVEMTIACQKISDIIIKEDDTKIGEVIDNVKSSFYNSLNNYQNSYALLNGRAPVHAPVNSVAQAQSSKPVQAVDDADAEVITVQELKAEQAPRQTSQSAKPASNAQKKRAPEKI